MDPQKPAEQTMKELLSWVAGVESSARDFYESAASCFAEDKDIAAFLKRLANGEQEHFDIVVKAGEIIKNKSELLSPVTVDDRTKRRLEDFFLHYGKKLADKTLTKEEIIQAVVQIEFTESNDIYLCVVNALKTDSGEYLSASLNIHKHKKYIEWFLKSRPQWRKYAERIASLPTAGGKNLLAVDDEQMLLDIYVALLADEGAVDTASNGLQAMKKLERARFNAIITDVDMPVMNGIEFYEKAVEKYPYLKDRFLFITGMRNAERNAFFKNNRLKNLLKPASIMDIRKAVFEIISGASPETKA
jgi:CheY-like chemotaxis protein